VPKIDTLLDTLTKLNGGKRVTISQARSEGISLWKVDVLGWHFRLRTDTFNSKEKTLEYILETVQILGKNKRRK